MIDREYYYSTYGGTAVQCSDFEHIMLRASGYVTSRLHRTYTVETLPDNVKNAICAIMDVEARYAGIFKDGNIQSQTVDGLSVTYRSSEDVHAQYLREKRETLEAFLPSNVTGVCRWI